MDFNKAYRDLIAGTKLYPVWLFQAYHELSSKYKRTFLGSLWIAGQFMATSLAITFVFGGLMGRSLAESLPYIMGGILAYSFVSLPLHEAVEAFVGAANRIRNHAYPFTYYIYETIAKAFMQMAHNAVVYMIFVIAVGGFKIPHWSLVITLPIVLLTLFFWSMITAIAAARFRDLRFTAPFIGSIFFFLTPVFWRVDEMGSGRSAILQYNPFYGLVEFIRSPLMGKMPPAICWHLTLLTLVIGVALWLFVFPAYRRRIPFWA